MEIRQNQTLQTPRSCSLLPPPAELCTWNVRIRINRARHKANVSGSWRVSTSRKLLGLTGPVPFPTFPARLCPATVETDWRRRAANAGEPSASGSVRIDTVETVQEVAFQNKSTNDGCVSPSKHVGAWTWVRRHRLIKQLCSMVISIFFSNFLFPPITQTD